MMVYEGARQAAQDIRATKCGGFNGRLTFPLLRVITQSFGACVYQTELDPGIVGIIIKYRGSSPRIYINSVEPSTRQLFTLAHELGHLVQRRYVGDDEYSFIDRRADAPSIREFYADEFAGELLMPSERFMALCKAKSVDTAAQEFGVSVSAACERLRRLTVHPEVANSCRY